MTSKKKGENQDKTSSDKLDGSVEVHEAFKLKEYFNILKSKKSVDELLENKISNDEAFKNFEDLMKTAKFRKHEK